MILKKTMLGEYYHIIHNGIFENKTSPALRGDAFFNLAAVENPAPEQRLLITIDALSSSDVYEHVDTQRQIIRLLIEYARDTHPKLMAEPTIQKAIAKYNLTETSTLIHRIYSFADYITKDSMNESLLRTDKVWPQELGEALQAAERQPGLLDNDRIIDDYAKKKSMSIARLLAIFAQNSQASPLELLASSISIIMQQLLNYLWVSKSRSVTEISSVVCSNFAQDTAHNFA